MQIFYYSNINVVSFVNQLITRWEHFKQVGWSNNITNILLFF